VRLKLLHIELGVHAGKERRQNDLKSIFKDVEHTNPFVNVILGVGGYVGNKEVLKCF
jgi:hypothetical protein